MNRSINLAAPPPCRQGGLGWLPREAVPGLPDAVLTVQAGYGPNRGYHQLPGGHAGHQEPDWRAMDRHVRHEIGRVPRRVRLLGKDWVPANATTGAAMGQNHIYLCEPVPAHAEIVLPPAEPDMEPELTSYRWMTLEDASTYMKDYQVRRFQELWAAWKNGTTACLDHGRPLLPAAV
ncbi:NUDIX domain-containing protein [Streptomyces albireticuli]|uniref:NUDIX domain-containing protein n=1 Tax=Streptomyces albireticuli TaxID=1940 RepID=UPI003688C694